MLDYGRSPTPEIGDEALSNGTYEIRVSRGQELPENRYNAPRAKGKGYRTSR